MYVSINRKLRSSNYDSIAYNLSYYNVYNIHKKSELMLMRRATASV